VDALERLAAIDEIKALKARSFRCMLSRMRVDMER
jgi:hypothetical protein